MPVLLNHAVILRFYLSIFFMTAKALEVKQSGSGSEYNFLELHLPRFIQNLKTTRLPEIGFIIPEIHLAEAAVTESVCSHIPKTLYSSLTQVNFEHPMIDEYRMKLQKKRFLRHNVLQILQVTSGNTKSLLKFLQILIQLGEPHRDYFIFLGSELDLNLFLSSKILSDIRFKFALTHDGSIIQDTNIFSEQMVSTKDVPLFEENPINLSGRRLKLSAAPVIPYISFTNGVVSGGCHYLMLYYMGIKYNYTMEVDTKNPKGAGYRVNGVWNGMSGDIVYRRSDVCVGLSITEDRYNLMDLIYTQTDSVLFMTRQPEVHPKWQAMFYPYTPYTWLCILVSYIAIILTLYLKMWQAKEEKKLFRSAFIPYQMALDQGFDILLPNAVKFITAVWMLFTIVISTGYKSDLVSWLAFPEPEKIPQDLDMLDRRPDYKVIFNYNAGTSFRTFDSAKYGSLRNVRQRFALDRDIGRCAIAAAMEPKTVCISWHSIMQLAIVGNLTLPGPFKPMVFLSKPVATFLAGIAFPKNSILADAFNLIVRYFRPSGLFPKWKEDVYKNFTRNGKTWMKSQRDGQLYKEIERKWLDGQDSIKPFKMKNVVAAFFICGISLALSVVLFCGELFYSTMHSIRNQKAARRKLLKTLPTFLIDFIL